MSISNFVNELHLESLQSNLAFGSKPWNCLNPVCKYYRTATIGKCVIVRDKNNTERVIGRFRCELCKFTYSRFGPDKAHCNQLSDGWVVEYGPLWNNYLQTAWMDEKINISLNSPRLYKSQEILQSTSKTLGSAISETWH